MRKILSIILVMLLVLSLFGGCTPKDNDGLVKVKVAHHAGLSGLSIPAADQLNNFFKDEGFEVEWVKFTSGPIEVAAMASGDIQFGFIGHGAHTLAAEGKIEIISLSNLGNAEQIITRAGNGINSIADLKGKKIAVQLGTSGEVILNLALQKAGMKKEDVQIIGMDITSAVSAFVANQVDVICAWDVHVANIRANVKEDKLNVIAKTSDFGDTASFPASWVVTPSYAKENPELCVKFIKALNKCYDFNAENFDAMVTSASTFGEVPKANLEATIGMQIYHTSEKLKEMVDNGELVSIYQKQLNYFISSGTLKPTTVKAADYVRTDLIKKAFESK